MGNSLLPRLIGALRTVQRALSFPVSALTALVTLGGLAACGSDNSFLSPAFLENVDRQYGVYALSGSPSALPAGYKFTTESLVRPQLFSDGTINFDVAFDITADGKALILPARLVAPVSPVLGPLVAFLTATSAYEQLLRAPEAGYVNDTTATLALGQSLLIRVTGSGCTFGEPIYAKITIDSIKVSERRLVVRSLVNRNCGYRALTAGLPKD